MNLNDLISIFLAAVGIFASAILFTRLVGLRSFSKMSSFDFAMTIATGSIIAGTVINSSVGLLRGAVGLGCIFLLQWLTAFLRKKTNFFSDIVDNKPRLIFRDGEFLTEQLKASNLTKSDVISKLREANAYDLSRVKAVVFEATGDVSVIHGEGELSPEVLEGVLGYSKSP